MWSRDELTDCKLHINLFARTDKKLSFIPASAQQRVTLHTIPWEGWQNRDKHRQLFSEAAASASSQSHLPAVPAGFTAAFSAARAWDPNPYQLPRGGGMLTRGVWTPPDSSARAPQEGQPGPLHAIRRDRECPWAAASRPPPAPRGPRGGGQPPAPRPRRHGSGAPRGARPASPVTQSGHQLFPSASLSPQKSAKMGRPW